MTRPAGTDSALRAPTQTQTLLLNFFGHPVNVVCSPQDADDVRFLFGPHVVTATPARTNAARVHLEAEDGGFFASLFAKDGRTKRFSVHDDAGDLTEERSFARWSRTPSPLPPFQLLRDHISLVQGTVLAKGSVSVALLGPPHSGKTTLGMSLAQRGWRLVSDQLLVVDRVSGVTYPYLVPVGLRGTTLAEFREKHAANPVTHRETVSEVTGLVWLVRPEVFGPTVPVDMRLSGTSLIHVNRLETGILTMQAQLPALRVWPAQAQGELLTVLGPTARHTTLNLPPGQPASRAAAEMIEEKYV